MDLERRRDPARQQGDRRVLNDDRVDAGRGDPPDQLLDRRELGLEYQRVERDVDPRATAMDAGDDLAKAGRWKVLGPRTCVEAVVEPEVDRIGAGRERGGEGIAVARGRQDLGAAHGAQPNLSGSVPYHTKTWKHYPFQHLEVRPACTPDPASL